MTEIKLYPQLGTNSKRALIRVLTSSGKPYYYIPRGPLLTRLAESNGMTLEGVREQLLQERQHFIDSGVIG